MKMQFPKIEKKIKHFLFSEEGKISKEALVKYGGMAAGILAAGSIAASKALAGHQNGFPNCEDTIDCPHEIDTDRWDALGREHTYCHNNDFSIDNASQRFEAVHGHCISTHSNVANPVPPSSDGGK